MSVKRRGKFDGREQRDKIKIKNKKREKRGGKEGTRHGVAVVLLTFPSQLGAGAGGEENQIGLVYLFPFNAKCVSLPSHLAPSIKLIIIETRPDTQMEIFLPSFFFFLFPFCVF